MSFEASYYCLTSCKKLKNSGVSFWRYFENSWFLGKIWPFDPLGGLDKSFPEHHIYVFWSLLLLSNFMQKIKKFWRLVLEIFWKQLIFGQNLTFWPLGGLDKSFPEHHIYVFWSLLLLSNFMQKIKKFWRLVLEIFWKRSIFGPNLTFWPPWLGVKSFFQKSEIVTFLHLWCCNFVQKIRKIWRADPEIWALRTDGQTDGRTDGRTGLNL